MDITDRLKEEYGYDTPILTRDISLTGVSNDALRQELSRMNRLGRIKRYSQGVYYFPTKNRLGDSLLSSSAVIKVKYISDGTSIYGYYTGLAILNKIGLTTQMPTTLEIVTNKESSKRRTVKIGSRNIILKKSNVPVTKENVRELQLLSILGQLDWKQLSKEQRLTLYKYVKVQRLSKEILISNLDAFPARAAKTLMEGELFDALI